MKPRYRVPALSRPVLTVVPFERPNDPEIAYVLSQFSELSERGDLTSIAVVAIQHDGAISSAYVLGSDLVRLAGGIVCLQHRVASNFRLS